MIIEKRYDVGQYVTFLLTDVGRSWVPEAPEDQRFFIGKIVKVSAETAQSGGVKVSYGVEVDWLDRAIFVPQDDIAGFVDADIAQR